MEPWIYYVLFALGGLTLGYLIWGPRWDNPVVTPPDEPPAPDSYTPFAKEPEKTSFYAKEDPPHVPPVEPEPEAKRSHHKKEPEPEVKRSHHKPKELGGAG